MFTFIVSNPGNVKHAHSTDTKHERAVSVATSQEIETSEEGKPQSIEVKEPHERDSVSSLQLVVQATDVQEN